MKEKFLQMLQTLREKTIHVYIPFIKKAAQNFLTFFKTLFKKGTETAPVLKNKITAFGLKWWRFGAGLLLTFFLLYYPAGFFISHHIDVDPDFAIKENRPVQTVGVLADILTRETSVHTFTPNKPFFYPSAFLDDMPSFQTGVISGIRSITEILSMVNAQSETLTQAAERLAYPPSIWHIQHWKPSVSSDKKYKKAASLLSDYLKNVAGEQESFNQSKEALRSIVEQIIAGLENCIKTLSRQVHTASEKMSDLDADNVFYETKGEAYVYYLTLRELRRDFGTAFKDSLLEKECVKAMLLIRRAVQILPTAVINGLPESQFAPNHLLNSGFYLSRAVSELKDMINEIQEAYE